MPHLFLAVIAHGYGHLAQAAPVAEEIEVVRKSERRELASRMAVLLAHRLKWRYQPDRQGSSWQRTIKEQGRAIAAHIRETPSLKSSLEDANWFEGVWADAVAKVSDEAGLDLFLEDCPWTVKQILGREFSPSKAERQDRNRILLSAIVATFSPWRAGGCCLRRSPFRPAGGSLLPRPCGGLALP